MIIPFFIQKIKTAPCYVPESNVLWEKYEMVMNEWAKPKKFLAFSSFFCKGLFGKTWEILVLE